jgi:hypothetical protein
MTSLTSFQNLKSPRFIEELGNRTKRLSLSDISTGFGLLVVKIYLAKLYHMTKLYAESMYGMLR